MIDSTSKAFESIKSFSGSAQDNARDWFDRAEIILNAFGIEESDRLVRIAIKFEDSAFDWYRNNRGPYTSWTQFRAASERAFPPPVRTQNRHLLAEQINQRKQGADESVHGYYYALDKLCRDYDPYMSAIDKAIKLVGGLRPELKEKVLPMNVQTPEEFMQHAKNFESTELVMANDYLQVKPMVTSQSNRYSTVAAIYPHQRSQLRKVTFDDRPTQLKKEQRERRDRRMNHRPIHRSESFIYPRYDQSRNRERRMKRDRQSKFHGMKCFRCGRYGHIRRECWSPRQSNHRPLSINQIEGNRSCRFQCRVCHEFHPSKRDLFEHLRLIGHYSAKRSDDSIRQHDWTIRRENNRMIDHRIRNDRKKRLWATVNHVEREAGELVDRFSSHRTDLLPNVIIALCSVSTQTDDPVESIGTTIARSEIRGSNRRQLMKRMNGTDRESNHRESTKGTIELSDEHDHRPVVENGAESNDQWNRRQPSKRNRRLNHRQSPDRTIDSSDQPGCRQQERTTTEPSKRWNLTQSSGPKDGVSNRLASGQSREAMMESKDRRNCSTWSKTSEIGNAERIKSYLREVIILLSDPMIERLRLIRRKPCEHEERQLFTRTTLADAPDD